MKRKRMANAKRFDDMPCNMQVQGAWKFTYLCADKRGHSLAITTPRGELQIFVTPTGFMRTFKEKP